MGRGYSTTSTVTSSSLFSSPSIVVDNAGGSDLEFDSTFPPPLIPSIPSHDLRLAAYDLLFSLCRSSPGFSFTTDDDRDDPYSCPSSFTPRLSTTQKSRTKRLLGLSHRRSPTPSSLRRPTPLSLSHLLRIQLRVPDHHDRNLRKTLNRSPSPLLLPIDHLRHLRPSDFPHLSDYHSFQKRQLCLLEAAFLPSSSNPQTARLLEILHSANSKPIDVRKNSGTMRALVDCANSLARGSHWANRYPLNIHLYMTLLGAVFDLADGAFVLDQADDLLELMKRTWAPLGLGRAVHGVCLSWVLFRQFIVMGEADSELLRASLALVSGVTGKGPTYAKAVVGAMSAMRVWSERRLTDYHTIFRKGRGGDGNYMDALIELALTAAAKMAELDQGGGGGEGSVGTFRNRVDYYIRSSARNGFSKLVEETTATDEGLVRLASYVEELIAREKERFGPVLRRWHPAPVAVAAATFHGCYGASLREYLAGVAGLSREVIGVLLAAGRLEKVLQTVAMDDDAGGGDDGVVSDMISYEVEATVVRLVRDWVEERLKVAMDCLNRAKETETWSPVSKTDKHAGSIVELLHIARSAIDDFVDLPVTGHDMVTRHLVDGLKSTLLDYITFAASCGNKDSYIPDLPPLTRCNQDSAFCRFWRRASPCRNGTDTCSVVASEQTTVASTHDNPRPSTSSGTQRLYVRLNTLHHLLESIQHLDESLTPYQWHPMAPLAPTATSWFDAVSCAALAAIHRIAEMAGYRLMFLDSKRAFYEGLYCGGVDRSRARPALRLLKQNLSVMATVVAGAAREAAVQAVLRAALEAFLYVIIAGGSERAFLWSDHEMVMEDLKSLKRVFMAFASENLVTAEVVDREAEIVEGIVSLMSLPTEQLIEDFSIVACETTGMSVVSVSTVDQAVMPIPEITGRWNRTDPHTVLRVLCHRDDETADRFLKKMFQLPRRR